MATAGRGTFCWFELTTTNTERAVEFYGRLFPWTPQPTPLPGGLNYTILHCADATVGAVVEMSAARSRTMQPHWTAYVQVDDVNAVAETAERLGGRAKENRTVKTLGREGSETVRPFGRTLSTTTIRPLTRR